VITAIAIKIARGTVRAGSLTSPPGTSAASMPANANTSRMLLRASVARAGGLAIARLAGSIANSPPATGSRSSAAETSHSTSRVGTRSRPA
jgi:hypothetical protein